MEIVMKASVIKGGGRTGVATTPYLRISFDRRELLKATGYDVPRETTRATIRAVTGTKEHRYRIKFDKDGQYKVGTIPDPVNIVGQIQMPAKDFGIVGYQKIAKVPLEFEGQVMIVTLPNRFFNGMAPSNGADEAPPPIAAQRPTLPIEEKDGAIKAATGSIEQQFASAIETVNLLALDMGGKFKYSTGEDGYLHAEWIVSRKTTF